MLRRLLQSFTVAGAVVFGSVLPASAQYYATTTPQWSGWNWPHPAYNPWVTVGKYYGRQIVGQQMIEDGAPMIGRFVMGNPETAIVTVPGTILFWPQTLNPGVMPGYSCCR